MFGYVTPLTEELKVKEHIFYKSSFTADFADVWESSVYGAQGLAA